MKNAEASVRNGECGMRSQPPACAFGLRQPSGFGLRRFIGALGWARSAAGGRMPDAPCPPRLRLPPQSGRGLPQSTNPGTPGGLLFPLLPGAGSLRIPCKMSAMQTISPPRGHDAAARGHRRPDVAAATRRLRLKSPDVVATTGCLRLKRPDVAAATRCLRLKRPDVAAATRCLRLKRPDVVATTRRLRLKRPDVVATTGCLRLIYPVFGAEFTVFTP